MEEEKVCRGKLLKGKNPKKKRAVKGKGSWGGGGHPGWERRAGFGFARPRRERFSRGRVVKKRVEPPREFRKGKVRSAAIPRKGELQKRLVGELRNFFHYKKLPKEGRRCREKGGL